MGVYRGGVSWAKWRLGGCSSRVQDALATPASGAAALDLSMPGFESAELVLGDAMYSHY